MIKRTEHQERISKAMKAWWRRRRKKEADQQKPAKAKPNGGQS